jgi:DNA polymerase-3 subunit epsilon
MNRHLDIPLSRPLVCFDLETTGTNIQVDRIVEISVVRLSPGGELEVKTRRINPERPIPPEATAIHGISDADVADQAPFRAVASSLLLYLEGCDLAGYNIQRFDLPLIVEEFKRAGLEFTIGDRRVIDAQTIFHKREPRTLEAAYRFYCGKGLEAAHSAEADARATLEVLQGELKKYPDLPRDIDALAAYSSLREPSWIDDTGKFKWQGDEPVVGFGRNAGAPLRDIAANNPGFLSWMINASFPADAVQIARDALAGKFPARRPTP